MYLAIDLGNKRCGLAVYVSGIVFPKDIVKREKLIPVVHKLISEYKVTTIVVGLPYDLYGKQLKQLHKTQDFIEKLKNIFPKIIIEGQDERFTSFEAEQTLKQMWVKDTREEKDALAAASILESYLNSQKNS